MTTKRVVAQFEGDCPSCPGSIDIGDEIAESGGEWHHWNCVHV